MSLAAVHAPVIDYKALSPLMATVGGSVVVMLAGLFRPRYVQRVLVPALTVVSLLAALGLLIWVWQPGNLKPIISGALTADTLGLGLAALCLVAGLVTVLLSLRAEAVREAGAGEYHALLLGSITFLAPLLWMLSTGLKPIDQTMTMPPASEE